MCRIWLLPALLLALLAAAAPCAAQAVHRCVDATGASYYTDRDCGDVTATERTAAPHAAAAVTRGPGCARNPEDLLQGVRSAIEAGNGNRLASFYDWQGMGGNAAYGVLDRLSLLSRDVLLDLRLDATTTAPGQPPPLPRALLVEQEAKDGNGASRITTFALVVHAGCWWLHY